MVSDFIVEGGGYLRDEQGEARLLLETHRDGYFNNDKFLEQVDEAIDVFNRKYPNHTAIFMFDNAPCHKTVSGDAISVDHMNVNPGGKQPKLRDGYWNGHVQKMVFPDGTPKGLKRVLEEQRVDLRGMVAATMREKLKEFPDCFSEDLS